MGMNWQELTIAIVAGDAREQEIARCAVRAGAQVRAYGFPWPDGGIEGVYHAKDAADALQGADVALFPIPGIADDGGLFTPALSERIIPSVEMLSGMTPDAHIILGWADDNLRSCCETLGIALHEYEWDVDLMLLRGQAIVEGILKVIIENTQITIHKANICLVGQGTIGTLLTRTLVALGARVSVAARSPVQRASAHAMGAESYTLEQLPDILLVMDVIIGSVPKQLIGPELLGVVKPDALLVDVAAPPGTFDRVTAGTMGIKTVWARGMGSRAPITVGRSQWTGISRRIEEIMEQRK